MDDPVKGTHLSFAFHGEAVEDGAIDVVDFAPAILGVHQALEVANEVLNGGRGRLSVQIRATRAGSFVVDLSLVMTLIEQARGLFESIPLKDASVLAKAVFGSAGIYGVLQLLLALKGKKPEKEEESEDGKSLTVTIQDSPGAQVVVAREVRDLANDPRMIGAMHVVTRPLLSPRFKDISIGDDQAAAAPVVVRREDALPMLEAPKPEPLEEKPQEIDKGRHAVTLMIETAAFYRGPKWRLSDGGPRKFNASIQDETFMDDVEAGRLTFGHGDALRVDLSWEMTRTAEGTPHTEYVVTKVHEVVYAPRAKQARLF